MSILLLRFLLGQPLSYPLLLFTVAKRRISEVQCIIVLNREQGFHSDDILGRYLISQPENYLRTRLPTLANLPALKGMDNGIAKFVLIGSPAYLLSTCERLAKRRGQLLSSTPAFDLTRVCRVWISPSCCPDVRADISRTALVLVKLLRLDSNGNPDIITE